ncbi:MAG: DctP family TRAP transporter solute-binding subunit, partial [Deltaproteobacteria bacterium]|nr:DctP family TRAP transporter solute-binding subunit [Deltaproteobacteria bacterium]
MTRAKAHTALLALFAIAFIGALPASSAHAKTTLRAAQVLNDTHPSHLGLLRMAELLKERSGGELEIRMLDRNTLGDERDLIEAIQMGEADLIVIGTAPLYSFTSDFLVFDLPYTFKDAPTGRAVMDGPFGQARLDDATHVGLKGLAYYENGLRHVSTSKAPVRLPGDMKGLRMRTMESRIHLQTFRQLGAYPVPLSYMDLYRHLKDGSIDAEENPTSVFVTGKLYEVQANFSLTGHFYMPSPMFVSMGVWNKLPPNLQGLL